MSHLLLDIPGISFYYLVKNLNDGFFEGNSTNLLIKFDEIEDEINFIKDLSQQISDITITLNNNCSREKFRLIECCSLDIKEKTLDIYFTIRGKEFLSDNDIHEKLNILRWYKNYFSFRVISLFLFNDTEKLHFSYPEAISALTLDQILPGSNESMLDACVGTDSSKAYSAFFTFLMNAVDELEDKNIENPLHKTITFEISGSKKTLDLELINFPDR